MNSIYKIVIIFVIFIISCGSNEGNMQKLGNGLLIEDIVVGDGNEAKDHNKVVVIEEISEEPCSICLEPLYDKEALENNKPVISLKCNHMFHKECLDPWIKTNKNCPLCKNNV